MRIIDYRRGADKGGILVNGKDQYIAVTEATSKKFKSLRGAQKFLESYGYRPVKGNETTSIGGERDVWEFVKENRDGAVHFLRLIKIRYTDGSPIYKSEFYDQGGHRLTLRFDSFEEAEETLQRLGYRLKNWNSYPIDVEFMDKREWVPPLTDEVRRQAGRLLASRKKSSIGGTRYRSDERNSRAEVYPGGQDEYGRDLYRVELREDNGHVEELYMTKTKLNRWLNQYGFERIEGTIRRYPEGEVETYFVDEDKFIPSGEYRETDF